MPHVADHFSVLSGFSKYRRKIGSRGAFINKGMIVNLMKNRQKLKKKGDSYLQNGRYSEALKCFDMILTSNPDDVKTLMSRAETLTALEKNSEAIECFEKILAIDPDDIGTLYFQGITFANLMQHTDAIRCCDRGTCN